MAKGRRRVPGGRPLREKTCRENTEGIDLQPIYAREDWEKAPPSGDLARPAALPKGSAALGSRPTGWKIAPGIALLRSLRSSTGRSCKTSIAARIAPICSSTRRPVSGLDPYSAGQPGEVGGRGLSLATLQDRRPRPSGGRPGGGARPRPAGISAFRLPRSWPGGWRKGGKPICSPGRGPERSVAEWIGRGSLPGGLPAAYDETAVLTAWAAGREVRA